MIQLTSELVEFPELGCSGHIFAAHYYDGTPAVIVGEDGHIGKLSINLTEYGFFTTGNYFYVKLYSEGLYLNEVCYKTGLFEKVGASFTIGFCDYQKWRIKEVNE